MLVMTVSSDGNIPSHPERSEARRRREQSKGVKCNFRRFECSSTAGLDPLAPAFMTIGTHQEFAVAGFAMPSEGEGIASARLRLLAQLG
jgi:hypothetical protein